MEFVDGHEDVHLLVMVRSGWSNRSGSCCRALHQHDLKGTKWP